MRTASIAFGALLLLGCKKETPPTPAPTASASATASAAGDARAPEQPVLARSTATGSPNRSSPTFTIAMGEIRVGQKVLATAPTPGGWGRGFPSSLKRSPAELYVVPLGDAMKTAPPGEVNVAFDGRTLYRTVVEVLFTLAQEGASSFHLLVTSASSPGMTLSLDFHPPKFKKDTQAAEMEAKMRAALSDAAAPDASARGKTLSPSVVVEADGYQIKTNAGAIGPGCKEPAPGMTVPKKAGAYDMAALTTCIARVATTGPKETVVTISASPDIDFQSVVGAVDAVRPTFPEPNFGVQR